MSLTITSLDGLALIEDGGRPGMAAEGISASGAWDRRSHHLANALLGNAEAAPVVELTLGSITFHADSALDLALAGPPLRVSVKEAHQREPRSEGTDKREPRPEDARSRAPLTEGDLRPGAAKAEEDLYPEDDLQSAVRLEVPAGADVTVTAPLWGARAYVALAGGISGEEVLGSLSTDTLGRLGSQPLRVGSSVAQAGKARARPATTIDARDRAWPGKPYILDLLPGPRTDWFTDAAHRTLFAKTYRVSQFADRVGIRLEGEKLLRNKAGELPSQPLVRGALQVPANGQPLIFGPDHPTTGGYPIIAVLTESSADASAQLRPGDEIRFRRVGKWPGLPLR